MSGEKPAELVIFDAYGTLLDVHAAMQRHADRLPPDWERISLEWRQKQLEYCWVETLTQAGPHRDFWTITEAALAFVADRHRIVDPALLGALMDSYRELPAYPDARPAIEALRRRGLRCVIVSNGDPRMLNAAVRAAGLEAVLDRVISVEDVGVFKPHPLVYTLAERHTGIPPARSVFVSSNAWDAQGAARAGMQVFWCNRSGNPHEYGLHHAATTIAGLAELETLV